MRTRYYYVLKLEGDADRDAIAAPTMEEAIELFGPLSESESRRRVLETRVRATDAGAARFWGDPISTYTDADGCDDGALVEPFPDKFPGWLFTIGVHEAILAAIAGTERTYAQAAIPLLMDAAMIVRSKRDHLHCKGLEGNVTGQDVWIGQNERAFTLLFPSEY